MTLATLAISTHDRTILREIGARIAEVGSSAVMDERRRLSIKLNRLEAERPMVLLWPGGHLIDAEFAPEKLACEGAWAKGIERQLREKLWNHEVIGDDIVINPRFEHRGFTIASDYGVQSTKSWGNDGQGHGSMIWDPPLKDLPADLEKLHFRRHTYDRAFFQAERALLEDVFAGVLPVVHRGIWYQWTMGLTIDAVDLIGLERFLIGMYDEPEHLHALMAFLRDDHQAMLDWYEQEGLLQPNNGDGMMGAGGNFYTDLLPQPDFVPGQPARLKDCWALSESQETVGVSPELFEEFVFQYQLPIISRFGLACYGCCEPLDTRWHIIKQIPNLRRVSVSPWSNIHVMAENLGKGYIYSRKPNPTLISTEQWDEDAIRTDLRDTLLASKGLNVEFIMKDIMTDCGQPWRYARWIEIAREEIDKVYGG